MKITRRQLKRIIKEEKAKVLKEWFSDEHDPETGERDEYVPNNMDQENAAYEQLELAFQNARKVLGANLLLQRLEDFIETIETQGS